jgi:hypothetical protein
MIMHKKKRRGKISVWAVSLWLIAFLLVSCGETNTRNEEKVVQPSTDHPASKSISGFHLPSYYAGTISTSAEFVSYGCKKLALSAPFTDDEIDVLLEHAQQKADEYGIPIYVEKELLVTRLFSPTVAEGKTVILFAYNQDVLDEYMALKEFKRKAVEEGRLEEVEEEIAWRFGRLLSYSYETIQRLLAEN